MKLRPQNNTPPVQRVMSDVTRVAPMMSPKLVNKNQKMSKRNLTIAGVFVLLIVGAITWYSYSQNVARDIQGSDYQAVFLDNGQVYFGKLSKIGSEYFRLSDIYYFESNNAVQTASTPDTGAAPNLIKLGKEIHGPRDTMVINKDKVLFFENITQDGAVGKAIKNNQSK